MILVFLVVAAVVKPKCKIKRSLNFVILNPRNCDLVLVKLARFLLFTGERVTRFSAGGGVSWRFFGGDRRAAKVKKVKF